MTPQTGGPVFAFAGGGSGGHVYPMVSLAREIRARMPGAGLLFFTTDRAIDERLVRAAFPDGQARLVCQPVRPLPRGPRDCFGFVNAWRASTKLCRTVLDEVHPVVVVGSGGYGSAPAVRVAAGMGIPTALLNPDAVPGKANRYLAHRTDVVFAQWAATESYLPRSARVMVLGCPIRPEFGRMSREAGVRRFGLNVSKQTVLVTGASQGAHSINRAIATIAGSLGRFAGWQYLHLAGDADVAMVRSAYDAASLEAAVLAYTEDMPAALAAADVAVTRAGASALAEITAVGVPSVILPYPYHRDRHQYANAQVLVRAGAAVLVEDRIEAELTGPALLRALGGMMRNPDRLAKMSQAALDVGDPVACRKITDFVFALVRQRGRGEIGAEQSSLHGAVPLRENRTGRDGEGGDGSPVDAAA